MNELKWVLWGAKWLLRRADGGYPWAILVSGSQYLLVPLPRN